jgi:arginase family enzyme
VRFNPKETIAASNSVPTVLLWGDGRTHHASARFAPQRPYYKVMFDAHTDLTDDNVLRAGSHARYTRIKDKYCNGFEVRGVTTKLKNENRAGVKVSRSISTSCKNRVVHASVDLDVLEDAPVMPGYAHGKANASDLMEEFGWLVRNNSVRRLDLGGVYFSPQRKDEKALEDSVLKHFSLISNLIYQYEKEL